MFVVRLVGAPSTIEQRLARRHAASPDELAWHLNRRAELDAILDFARVADAEVAVGERTPTSSSGRTPGEVASELVQLAGW